MPWTSELAQLPTPMIATRTLAWSPGALPSVETICGFLSVELRADVEDALEDGDPGGRGEQVDRPWQHAPGREDEPGRDHYDARGAEPVEEQLVAVLEVDDHARRGAEEHAGGGQGVRGDARACQAEDRA